MTDCPNCGTSLPGEAQFCSNCGENLSRSCPQCNAGVRTDASFCPDCGADLTAGERGMDSSASGPSSDAWRLASDELAKRLGDASARGDGLIDRLVGRESVTIEEGNRALLLEGGEIAETLGPGEHTLDTFVRKVKRLGRGREYTVVVVDETATSVPVTVENLRTADEDLVELTLETEVRVDDRERFFRTTMDENEVVSTATVARQVGSALRDELQAVVAEYDRESMYGNRRFEATLRDAVADRLGELFDRRGLSLVEVVSVAVDDDREELRERRQDVEIEKEHTELDREVRELNTDDAVHEARQEQRERVGKRSAEQSADHEIEMQSKEHEHEEVKKDHEIDDTRRRHRHTAEREEVEHEEDVKTTRKESEVERRDVEHEQDVKEMQDLMDIKKEKDRHKLDREKREQEIEMEREREELAVEKERLEARDDVDAETLASLEDTDEEMADLAKMDKATDLSPEQLDALEGHEEARKEAKKAEHERKRVEDQKEFREELKEVAEESMDRTQETADRAMDEMGNTAEAAAEDTSDNVIVSGDSGDSGGDTTIVQGGGGGDGGSDGDGGDPERVVVCPDCGNEQPYGHDFCMQCGGDVDPDQ